MLDSDEDDLGFDDDVLIFESDKPDFSVTDRYTHKPGMPDPAQFNIFSACKAGDLFRVRVLIEEHDVDVNRKDEFDSIPLFYACLCGHANIVKYLLDRGARLDAGTFEGARCFYAALDDNIRKLLKTYKAKPVEFDDLAEAFGKVFDLNPDVPFADFELLVEDKPIRVHRVFLMANCEFFNKLLSSEKWANKRRLRFTDSQRIKFNSMRSFLRYLYTDQLQIEIDSFEMESLLYIIRKMKMKKLYHDLENYILQARSRNMKQLIIKPRNKSSRLRDMLKKVYGNLYEHKDPMYFPDVKLKVYSKSETNGSFDIFAHIAVLWSRSEYFRALFSGRFKESKTFHDAGLEGFEEDEPIDIEILDILTLQDFDKGEINYLLEYAYTGNIELKGNSKNFENDPLFWYNILLISELCMMTDMRLLCFRKLGKCISLKDLWKILSVGLHHGSRRLIDECIDFIRSNVRLVYSSQELNDLMSNSESATVELKQLLEDELAGVWEYMSEMYKM